MGVRLYDPTAGRFLLTDPVPGGSANTYDYGNAEPLDHYDLGGRWWGYLYR
ncbi:UNVERIFIED_CONTAM: RHS repeat-associated protein [Streptomyces canus]